MQKNITSIHNFLSNISNHYCFLASKIIWSERKNGPSWNGAYSSIDGTDFRIAEPYPFDKGWYSHKFNSAALRYEIAVSISGNIVWCHGPFPAGTWPDNKIFNSAFVFNLDHLETVVSDKGYSHKQCVTQPRIKNSIQSTILKRIRGRHEVLNRRIKCFNILSSRFRHALHLHEDCLFAVVNVVQEAINCGHRLFDI